METRKTQLQKIIETMKANLLKSVHSGRAEEEGRRIAMEINSRERSGGEEAMVSSVSVSQSQSQTLASY